jgi:hypothetical protein
MPKIPSLTRCACAVLLHSLAVLAAVTNSGFTVVLNDVSYYVPPYVVATIATPSTLSVAAGNFIAITVLSTSDASFNSVKLAATKSNFTKTDDVWQDGFSDALYLQYTGSGAFASTAGLGTVITAHSNASSTIPTGPYFMSATGSLYQAHRLYSDSEGAFTETMTQDPSGTYSVLPAGFPGQNLAVAVPSRLYFTKTAAKPLAGVRIGVKDLFDIAGLRRSNGNRAWYHLYPPANTTGTAIQNLIDAGAILVGKLKLSQFANGETATADWVSRNQSIRGFFHNTPFCPHS